MTSGWIESAKAVPLVQIAADLGFAVEGRHHLRGACPACNEGARSRHDRRGGALFLTGRNARWRCQRCDAHGDGVELARLVLSLDWPELRAWFASRGWCEPAADRPPPPRVKPRPVPPPPPSQHPSPEVLRDFWERCVPVGDDPAVVAWLRSRGIDPATVEDRGLARAVPPERCRGPWWSWYELSARCVFGLVDESGELATLRGRRVEGDGPKVLALRDAPPAVLADGTAVAVLRGEQWPHEAGVRRVCVCEGEIDWLARNLLLSEDQSSPAVLGITGSGAWPEWLGAQIPDGWSVEVDAHLDLAGQQLLSRVVAAVGDRCPIARAAPRGAA